MALEVKKLKVWTGEPETLSDSDSAPLPKPWGVLYSRPNPDGTRKMCSNCTLWSLDQQCAIHEEGLPIVRDAICGYHVYGKPSTHRIKFESFEPVYPELSGLQVVPGGKSCDVCKFYSPRSPVQGICSAIVDEDADDTYAIVDALGSCARWESSEF